MFNTKHNSYSTSGYRGASFEQRPVLFGLGSRNEADALAHQLGAGLGGDLGHAGRRGSRLVAERLLLPLGSLLLPVLFKLSAVVRLQFNARQRSVEHFYAISSTQTYLFGYCSYLYQNVSTSQSTLNISHTYVQHHKIIVMHMKFHL